MDVTEKIVDAAISSLDWAKANPKEAEQTRNDRETHIKPYGKPTVKPPSLSKDGSVKKK